MSVKDYKTVKSSIEETEKENHKLRKEISEKQEELEKKLIEYLTCVEKKKIGFCVYHKIFRYDCVIELVEDYIDSEMGGTKLSISIDKRDFANYMSLKQYEGNSLKTIPKPELIDKIINKILDHIKNTTEDLDLKSRKLLVEYSTLENLSQKLDDDIFKIKESLSEKKEKEGILNRARSTFTSITQKEKTNENPNQPKSD